MLDICIVDDPRKVIGIKLFILNSSNYLSFETDFHLIIGLPSLPFLNLNKLETNLFEFFYYHSHWDI